MSDQNFVYIPDIYYDSMWDLPYACCRLPSIYYLILQILQFIIKLYHCKFFMQV